MRIKAIPVIPAGGHWGQTRGAGAAGGSGSPVLRSPAVSPGTEQPAGLPQAVFWAGRGIRVMQDTWREPTGRMERDFGQE